MPIFTASSALVGVCITVISIVRTFPNPKAIGTWVDDVLAVDAMLFLISCALAYGVLRSRDARRIHRLETAADIVFLAALGGMVTVCATVVWELA